MPVYFYKGIDGSGKSSTGTIDAENLKSARVKLRKLNLFPTDVREASGGRISSGRFNFSISFQRITAKDLALMTRQLATLVGANIPLVDALGALVEQTLHPKLKEILSKIRERVTEGGRLSDAMRAHPKVFSDLFVNMVAAGEASGALEVVLERLADFTEAQVRLQNEVKGALFYPLIMLVIGIGLMGFLFVFVIPKITKIFENTKATLPLPTKILVGVSNFAVSYWYLALILIPLLIYGFVRFKRSKRGREWIDRLSLKVFLFGEMFRMIAISRFCRTLATLTTSGVQLLTAMDIVKHIVQNSVLTKVIEETKNSVKEGESIAEPLRRSGEFPPLVTQMIAIGEKTGELEKMLERIADAYDQQVQTRVATLTSLLEPLMIVIMGLMVAGIVLSIMLPILKLNQLVKR